MFNSKNLTPPAPRQKMGAGPGMVVQAFNPSTQEAKAGTSVEFETSLVYTAGPTGDPVSQTTKTNT